MKKILAIASLVIATTVLAQKTGAPEAAKAAFKKIYPAAAKVKWEKEDGNYEVSFVLNGKESSVIYDVKGILLESEQEIKVTELPAAITTYLKEHYKGVTIKGAAMITKAGGTINYEAAVKGKDVLFDANGKLLKEVKD
jgi:hypothetical protein